MATHSSVLDWRIPGTGEPGGLLSVGSAQSRTRLKRLSIAEAAGLTLGQIHGLFWLPYEACSVITTPIFRWEYRNEGSERWNNFPKVIHCFIL